MITELSIAPLLGLSGVVFGMSRESVIAVLGEPQTSFRRNPLSNHVTDGWFDGCLQVSYAGQTPAVDFIELSYGPRVDVLLFGVAVFNMPSGELLQTLRSKADWDESEGACAFTCSSLELAFWLPTVDDAAPFKSLGAGVKGYYSENID